MAGKTHLMRIGELARLTGKTVRALRLYEEVGLLEPTERSNGGYRMYEKAHTDRIEYINRLQDAGLSLNEIAGLVQDWKDQTNPKAAMEHLETRYRRRLKDVKDKIKALKTLEGELVASLGFLEGCHGCSHEESSDNACGTCIQTERADEESPNLILGLTAH